MPDINSDQLFIGFWVALVALFIFERRGKPRRVPVWAAIALGAIAMFVVPPLLDGLTGQYQPASLRANVNQCTKGLTGQLAPTEIANSCDYSIVVGMCSSNEKNPSPCKQTVEIAPNGSAKFDPKGEQVSSLPSSAGGLTVVACRPPLRPSRALRVGGRGYQGVCLPEN